MKTLLLFLITISLMLNASEHESCDDNHTEGHKHSHGIYKKIDDLDKRKTVRKKPLAEEELVRIAKHKLQTLVEEKKISKTWRQAYEPVITRTKYKFVNDYMIVFHNPKIKKKKYRNLYIFVNAYGDVKGANYSGK